jgi:hypothetical protein
MNVKGEATMDPKTSRAGCSVSSVAAGDEKEAGGGCCG